MKIIVKRIVILLCLFCGLLLLPACMSEEASSISSEELCSAQPPEASQSKRPQEHPQKRQQGLMPPQRYHA